MTKFNNKTLLAAAIAVSLTMAGSASATNGYFSHAYSQKEAGLAGAGVAKVKDIDALAGATNPANMVFAGDRWDLGINLFNPDRTYESKGNPALPSGFAPIGVIPSCSAPGQSACQLPFSLGPDRIKSDNQLFPIPSFGWNKMLTDRSSFGVMVYGNGGMNTEYQGGTANVFNPGTGTIVTAPGLFGGGTTGVDLMQLFVVPTYSMKVGENSSIGFGVIGAFQRFKATGLRNFGGVTLDPNHLTDQVFDPATGEVLRRNGYATSTGFGFKLGFNSEIQDGLRLAGSYQSTIKMSEFDEYRGLFAENGDFDIPETWTVGISADVGTKGVFVLDFQRIKYNDVKSIGNGIDPLTSGQCLDALNSVLFGGPAEASGSGCGGGSNGFGFGWNDMSIVKLGYEWQQNDVWTFRVGYSVTSQPIDSSEVIFNILAPAVIEDHFTAGFTKELSDKSEITMSFMYGKGDKVSGQNPFDPGQTLSIEMDQYQLGFTYSRR
ncbi:MAG: outer membrane protein transport protein [Alcanivoracaceae bacterium]|nr:outer membrane protein transport protein [Alcanivoracaceae bacterium]